MNKFYILIIILVRGDTNLDFSTSINLLVFFNYMKTQFLIDNYGKKVAVILPVKEYIKILEKLEELDDIHAYDKAKKYNNGKRILLSDYIRR